MVKIIENLILSSHETQNLSILHQLKQKKRLRKAALNIKSVEILLILF